jgi:hypothetical protein
LVGHHSEKQHRRDLANIHSAMRRSVDAGKEAEELRRRAAAVGSGGISSDDPEAGMKIEDRIAELEDKQMFMKTVNVAHARFLRNPASLDTVKLSEAVKEQIRTYQPQYSWEPHPFPPYATQNLGRISAG